MAVLGTKSESIFVERIFSNSTTWTPSFSCRAYVTVIGPGGSGGSARNTSDNRAAAASGGGAGGCARSLLILSSSVTYTITIGTGGASVSGAAGNAGGASSEFTGSDITDMAGAVGSGGAQGTNATTVATQAGGAGGAATGGNIWNVTGGAGGSATVSYWEVAGIHNASGGGGAPGVLGTVGGRGGNALSSVDGYDKYVAAGGGGIGGRGGDATLSGGTTNYLNTQGGCGDRDGDDVDYDGNDSAGCWATLASGLNPILNGNYNSTARLGLNTSATGIQGYPNYTYVTEQSKDAQQASLGQGASIFHGLSGQGGSRTQDDLYRPSGPGAGGSGWSAYSNSIVYMQMCPGLFGGGGGTGPNYADSVYADQPGYAGAGSFGAGGGGIAGYASSSNTTNSGAGGAGMVVVTILEPL